MTDARDGTEAIVVGRQDLGEADRIVRLLTAREGRVDVVARGARSSRRRFGGALEPGTRLRAQWRRGRGSLATLTGVDVIRAPHHARASYDRLVLLGYGCDLLATLSEVGLAQDKGFGLLCAWLDRLEEPAPVGDPARLALEAKALTFAGLAPRLVTCAVCGGPVAGDVRFDAEAGGAVHPGCGGGVHHGAADLAQLETWRRTPLAEVVGTDAPSRVRWLLVDFVEHHTRRPVRARALLGDPEDT